jgi:predicted CXXCH cytochrome family protein
VSGGADLTKDLSNDHPISFSYLNASAGTTELAPLQSLPAEITFQWGDYLQCTACHDPHNNEFGNFLVMNNSDPTKPGYTPGSPLCTSCHKNTEWPNSTHNHAITGNPQFATACMVCHTVHTAPGSARLLNAAQISDTCYLACHGNSSLESTLGTNVKPLFSLLYRHPVGEPGFDNHDEGDEKTTLPVPAAKKHVECVDCHNPHQVNAENVPTTILSPPAITGRLKGVTGIAGSTRAIVTAAAEYEVCFKCHSGVDAGEFRGIDYPNRLINDPDLINRFDPAQTTSYHPVMGQSRFGTNGASLIAQYQGDMVMIYCTDCHNSDQGTKAGGAGADGPHGSNFKHILIARYDMPLPAELPFTSQFDLCYRCHSETFIFGAGSGFATAADGNEHTKHVTERGTPCFACHDPHGVPGAGPLNTHLINFSVEYAGSAAVYTPLGVGSGSCTVSCHTVGGPTRTYP